MRRDRGVIGWMRRTSGRGLPTVRLMRRRASAAGLLVALLGALGGCASTQHRTVVRAPSSAVDVGVPHRDSPGAQVLLTSGCPACHRLGSAGNDGPGPQLTHVGARLDTRAIRHVIRDPRAPMPAYGHLPRARLRALVAYLAALR